MRIFGFDLSRSAKQQPQALHQPVAVNYTPPAVVVGTKASITLAPPQSGRWITIFDQYSGAWQQDVSLDQSSILRYSTVFRCIALISGDIAKLCLRLMQLSKAGVWLEVSNPAYSPLLRKPNAYQTRLEFIMFWLVSLLLTGNAYILKRYDGSGKVRSMTVLDPNMVQPVVAKGSGEVFYKLTGVDDLAGIVGTDVMLPARMVIHDKYICLNHPLIGNSPLQVAGASATASKRIVDFNANFYTNQARPAGVLEAPGEITPEQAARLKEYWGTFNTTATAGTVAVLEGGLKFSPLGMTSSDAQMLELLEFNQHDIARAFGVPGWLIEAGAMPTAANAEVSKLLYYGQTLQVRIEAIELLLDDALGLTDVSDLGVEFDLDGLLRTDSLTQVATLEKEIQAAIRSPNEARAKRGLEPAEGGDSPMMQQQNYSLAALAKRDAKADPFAAAGAAGRRAGDQPGSKPAAGEEPPPAEGEATAEDVQNAMTALGGRRA